MWRGIGRKNDIILEKLPKSDNQPGLFLTISQRQLVINDRIGWISRDNAAVNFSKTAGLIHSLGGYEKWMRVGCHLGDLKARYLETVQDFCDLLFAEGVPSEFRHNTVMADDAQCWKLPGVPGRKTDYLIIQPGDKATFANGVGIGKNILVILFPISRPCGLPAGIGFKVIRVAAVQQRKKLSGVVVAEFFELKHDCFRKLSGRGGSPTHISSLEIRHAADQPLLRMFVFIFLRLQQNIAGADFAAFALRAQHLGQFIHAGGFFIQR